MGFRRSLVLPCHAQLNDVFFAVHAVLLTLITVFQVRHFFFFWLCLASFGTYDSHILESTTTVFHL